MFPTTGQVRRRPVAAAATAAAAGFTLVELLVVIGIVAVLIGILLPVISKAKVSANTAACAANLRSIGQALRAYETEFGTYPFSIYFSSSAAVGNREAINDGADDHTSGGTYTWWSVLRKVMRGGKGNWDNSVHNVDGSRSTRFMAAFNCPLGYNRDAGCDFATNPVIMPDLRAELQMTSFTSRQLRRPAASKSLYPDNVVMFDAAELNYGDQPYTRQFATAYDLDGGRLMLSNTNPDNRFRGLIRSGSLMDGTLADPGPNKDSDATSSGLIGQIRWRHGRNDSANFLFADSSVRAMPLTRNYDSPTARGELTRAMLRPKPYPGYRK
jgi:prepilin-type N-terminal cleavage/methylation domain-containing protein/prepilin-type processing-associated H-X9-DG protein